VTPVIDTPLNELFLSFIQLDPVNGKVISAVELTPATIVIFLSLGGELMGVQLAFVS